MAKVKYSKEEIEATQKQTVDLLKLILRKTGTTHKSIVDFAEQQFVAANLDLVTPSERKRFNKLVF